LIKILQTARKIILSGSFVVRKFIDGKHRKRYNEHRIVCICGDRGVINLLFFAQKQCYVFIDKQKVM
jgi:hypothetical protein